MSSDLEVAFLLAILGGAVALVMSCVVTVRAYRRFRSWLENRRRERARKALSDVFGGAVLLVHPLNRDHLQNCTEYEWIHTPAERVRQWMTTRRSPTSRT